MCALNVSKLAIDLRALADSAERRLWVASPYIGSWRAVKKILGSAWQKVDVRLLTDKDSGILAQDTIEQFAAHRPVRSLGGLHAKLYIVDDSVLLTSANLTEAAFTRRYEVGLILEGDQARALIKTYENLWDRADEVDVKLLSFTRPRKGDVGESYPGGKLPRLYDLPSDPGPAPKSAGAFADYPHFLDEYRRFAKAYVSCGEQDRPGQPLYLETDKFLNFLYNEDKSSREYKDKPHRNLSDSERVKVIQKYRERHRRLGLSQGGDHTEPAKLVQKYLAPAKIMQLTEREVRMVAKSLNSLDSNPLNLYKFLNKTNNDLDKIRRSWRDLVHGSGELIHDPGNLKLRMNRCHSALLQFGKAAIQEMLGYYYPDKYPLRNTNTNAGLRFLGYNVN